MRKKHKRKSDRKKLQEYSKRVLAAMILLWFAVALFGVGVIVYQLLKMPEYGVNIDGLFTFVGYPMTGGIVTYLIKSAVENRQKIKNNTPNSLEEDNPQPGCSVFSDDGGISHG